MITVKIGIWLQARNAIELLFGLIEDVEGWCGFFLFPFSKGYEESA